MSSNPPQQPVGSSGAAGYPQKPRNGLGTAALILGILAILTIITIFGGPILGIIAIILGFIGRGRAKRGEATNGGMAMAGIVLGAIAIIASIGLAIAGYSLFKDEFENLTDCLDSAENQEDREQCAEDFKEEVEEETDN
jgi:phosphate/sulfate permease